jgi:hypothetical protein
MGDEINGMEVCKKYLADRLNTVACVSSNTPARKDMVAYLRYEYVNVHDIAITAASFEEAIYFIL